MPRRAVKLQRLEDQSFCATFDNGQLVRAKSVVVATGVQYRRPPLARLADFEGAGIYYCRISSVGDHPVSSVEDHLIS
jgi:thioredoxin reductase (NADPH)